ncbi:uncharacterized protein LOC122094808 [Macadamia integrifolia]|uniref:uncharacterized protein LOC122094808 n=1 Tax=Macadamia integrifolia TaxID=60698 RepID=UPI001C52F885|nr:uncharacterized protein LOC122094808 [Macadamia integrifolia]
MESNVASTGVQQLSSAQKTGGGSGDGVSGQSEVMIDYGKSINPLMHLYKMMPQFEDACLSCMSQQVNNDGAMQLVPEIKVTLKQLLEKISHYLATLDEKLKKHYNSDDNEDDAPSKKLNKKKRPLLHHATHSPSSFKYSSPLFFPL